jgi:hypothetical protein
MPNTIDARPAPATELSACAAQAPARCSGLGCKLVGERSLAAAALAGVVVLGTVLALPLLTGRVPIFGDLGIFHLPIRDFYSRCLKSGERFDWLPGMHAGVFITGEGEHGPYHPLHLLLYWALPLHVAFAAEVVLSYPLIVLGTYLFLCRHAGHSGALLAGLVYAFSANNLYHANHVNFVAVLGHLPWLLWLTETLARCNGSRRRLAVAGIALLTGSQVLLGHPQALYYSLLAEGLYALFLVRAANGPTGAALAWCTAKGLSLAVGAVQLLATLSLLTTSNRGTFDPLYGAFVPRRLIQLLVPTLMARHVPDWWDEPFYFGAPAVVLLVWWLAARQTAGERSDSGERRLTWFAVTLGVLATWLAIGHYGGLYVLQTYLPVVGQFRAPSRYVNLTAFAGALLAGVSIGRLARRLRAGRPLPWRHLALPWAVAAFGVAAAVAFHVADAPADGRWLDRRFLSGALAVVGAALCLTLAVRGRTVGLYGLVLLAALDLLHHSLRNPMWGAPVWKDAKTLAEFNAATERPPEAYPGRVFGFTGPPTRLLLLGERLADGYRGGIEPGKRLDYLCLASLRVAGVSWYRDIWTQQTCQVDGLEARGNYWYHVPDPLPRVRLMSRAAATDDPGRDLPALDVDHVALTDRRLEFDGGPAGTADLVEEHPGSLCVVTLSEGKRLLVLSESHDPGWRVNIDGSPAEVERVNGDFLGCVVGPGKHRVEFSFRPSAVRLGLPISLCGLATVLLLGGWAILAESWLRRRAARDTQLTEKIR